MIHCAFLQPEWPQIAASATKAESLAMADPRTACFYARRALALMVTWLYESADYIKHYRCVALREIK